MIRCTRLRCQWRSDDQLLDDQGATVPVREQLAAHAADAGHPLCAVCRRSLQDDERVTCEKCLTRARANLKEIVELYALLPFELGIPKAAALDGTRPGAGADPPMPGGDVLTLSAGGGTGDQIRRLPSNLRGQPARWWLEGRHGPLTLTAYRTLERAAEGREHHADNHDDDAPSVPEALARWEDDWRHVRGEHAAVVPNGEQALAERTMVAAAGYLERRMRWAAEHHDLFPDFSTELHDLRARLQTATAHDDRPVRAPAVCFDCGQDSLERRYTEARPCRHVAADQRLLVLALDEQLDTGERCETRLGRESRLKTWEAEHKQCQQGGLVEVWTCRRCHRTYEEAEYWLAVRARLMATTKEKQHA